MSYADMQEYKYVMDVDGAGTFTVWEFISFASFAKFGTSLTTVYAWTGFTSRFPGHLRSGTLVFKSTKYSEWFYERVRPWVDYVPVNYDLSDLVSKVEWAHFHPEKAESMAKHAREMSYRHIRYEDKLCYMYRLILEYDSLFEKS